MLPIISIINKSTIDFKLVAMAAMMQRFVDGYFAPEWGTPCILQIVKKPVKGTWHFVFIDNADAANALGYHEYIHGMPLAKIFVKTTLDDGQKVSVTATHELAEMLVDPDASKSVRGPKFTYSFEVADAVEETSFVLNNMEATNFVLPTWFQNFKHPVGTKFDYLGKCKRPFQLLKGGYAAVQDANGNWTQIFGSLCKQIRFENEDRRGHRVESLIMKGLPYG